MDIRPLLSTVTQIIKLNYIREAGSGKITLTYQGSYYDVRGMWYYTAMIITGRLLTCKIKFFVCKIARIVLATTFHPTLGRWLTCWWCRCSFFNTWTTYRAVVQLYPAQGWVARSKIVWQAVDLSCYDREPSRCYVVIYFTASAWWQWVRKV